MTGRPCPRTGTPPTTATGRWWSCAPYRRLHRPSIRWTAPSPGPWGVGLPPADAAALEHALRVCDAGRSRGGGVRGPESVDRVLREVAASRGGRPGAGR